MSVENLKPEIKIDLRKEVPYDTSLPFAFIPSFHC